VAWVFLLGLAALVGGVGIVALIETEPGYLLIAYGGYTVETSFWVGILAIATLVLAFYAALRFLSRLIASPGSLLNWASARRLRQSSRLTTRGLVSFVEGNWRRARRQLLRGARYSEAPMLNYLIAARASYRLEEPEAMREYLAAASDSDVVDASIAVELTRAELLLHAQRYEEALTTLSDASKHASRNPYVFHLLSRAHEGLGDAEALVALMPELRRHQLRTVAELDALEDKVHRALLDEAATVGDGALLQARWKKLPARIGADPRAQLAYFEGLLKCGETAVVEKAVLKHLRKHWDAPMVSLYGRIPRDSARKPLAIASGWLKQHPDDPDLLLCLGRLALQEREWQRARDYLERSHRLRPSEEACLELGRLLAAAGEHAAAAAAFYTGTQLRSDKLPELPQPDDVLPGSHRLEETASADDGAGAADGDTAAAGNEKSGESPVKAG
jgi:HemY protein